MRRLAFASAIFLAATAMADEQLLNDQLNALGNEPVIRLLGNGFNGRLPGLTPDEVESSKSLRQHVKTLATEIGERNLRESENLQRTEVYIEDCLLKLGHTIERQTYKVDGVDCHNLIAQRQGATRPNEIVVIGAHYDSGLGTPGANDNGSGVAALLELAKRFSKSDLHRTLRLIFFVNEEPPYFQTDEMGSMVYARRCKERKENITAVVSLETIGYYSDEEGSQNYPFPLGAIFPKTGNFIGFVGNVESGPLVQRVLTTFQKHVKFPSEGTSLPDAAQGIGWSDQWSFWKLGYPGVMVTDTAPFRYPHCHRPTDTPDKIDYERMARVVTGLAKITDDLVNNLEE